MTDSAGQHEVPFDQIVMAFRRRFVPRAGRLPQPAPLRAMRRIRDRVQHEYSSSRIKAWIEQKTHFDGPHEGPGRSLSTLFVNE
ncbi:MAG: hypothetical protein H6816_14970 [Phycisphaerales bacterium]|nr:hypothetical protein [Phycisphaerales bacterium]